MNLRRSGLTVRRMMWALLALLGLGLMNAAVAAAKRSTFGGVEDARLIGTELLQGQVFHIEGLALGPTRIWVTSIDKAAQRGYLHEFDRASGKLIRQIDLTDGPRCHPGGISLSGRSLWIPMAETRPDSSAVLLELDTGTLQVQRRIPVSDHIGFVAASPLGLVAGNWDSKLLYEFGPSGNGPIRVVNNPSATRYQDMKFVGNQLVAGGDRSPWSGTVDWLAYPSLQLVRSLHTGAVEPIRPIGRGGPYSSEGMAIEGRDLYFAPEDGPSRVFHFRLNG